MTRLTLVSQVGDGVPQAPKKQRMLHIKYVTTTHRSQQLLPKLHVRVA